jgi:hypothetical protein
MSRIFSSAEPGPQLTWTAMILTGKSVRKAIALYLHFCPVQASAISAPDSCPSRSDTTWATLPQPLRVWLLCAADRRVRILGKPATSRIDLKCLARQSAFIGRPDTVLKTKSMPSGNGSFEVVAIVLAMYRPRRITTIQLCSLISRRLRERFTTTKHHLSFSLRRLRTTLTVCRNQSMSCYFKPKYSLGRTPVATANAGPDATSLLRRKPAQNRRSRLS